MRRTSSRAVWSALTLVGALTSHGAELAVSGAARAEGRLRAPVARGELAPAVADALVAPSLDAAVDWGSARLGLRYSADVLLRGLVGAPAPVLLPLHQAQAAFDARVGRAALRLTQDFGIGTIVVSALDPLRETPGVTPAGGSQAPGSGAASGGSSAGGGASGGAAPAPSGPAAAGGLGLPTTAAIVPYLVLRTTAEARLQLLPRLEASVRGGYAVSGATDGSSPLPLQRGPHAGARLEWRVDRRHALAVTLDGRHLDFSTRHRQTLARVEGEWSAALDPSLSVEGSLGAAFSRQELPAETCPLRSDSCAFMDLLPVAAVGARGRHSLGPVSVAPQVRARLAPFADRYTGLVSERAEAQLALSAGLRQAFAAGLSATAAWSVPLGSAPYVPYELLAGEAEVSWTPLRWVTLGLGGRLVRAPQLVELLWSTNLSVTVRTDAALVL